MQGLCEYRLNTGSQGRNGKEHGEIFSLSRQQEEIHRVTDELSFPWYQTGENISAEVESPDDITAIKTISDKAKWKYFCKA